MASGKLRAFCISMDTRVSMDTAEGTHVKRLVAGVASMLNSATGTPLDATWGANMAAG